MTAEAEHRLRDDLTVVLLEATSSVAANALLRAEVRDGRPVYDPVPAVPVRRPPPPPVLRHRYRRGGIERVPPLTAQGVA